VGAAGFVGRTCRHPLPACPASQSKASLSERIIKHRQQHLDRVTQVLDVEVAVLEEEIAELIDTTRCDCPASAGR